jgi:hypothetical protein
MIDGTPIRVALVSTNSVAQGEAVANTLETHSSTEAYTSIMLTARSDGTARPRPKLMCIVSSSVSVRPLATGRKSIYEGDTLKKVSHINAYLIEADDIFVESAASRYALCPKLASAISL